MPVQGASQSFRDQFSVPGMSQVPIVLNRSLRLFRCTLVLILCCVITTFRISWVMTSKARDLMFLIMLLISPLRYVYCSLSPVYRETYIVFLQLNQAAGTCSLLLIHVSHFLSFRLLRVDMLLIMLHKEHKVDFLETF